MPSFGDKCMYCEKDAQFSWCRSEAFEEIDTFNVADIPNELVNVEYMCSECLINKLAEIIEVEGIILKEFFPPVDHEGIAISGDY